MNMESLANLWAMGTIAILCIATAFIYLKANKHHSPHNFADTVQALSILIAGVSLSNTLSNLGDPALLGPCFAYVICLILYGTLVKIGTHIFLFLSLYEPPPINSEVKPQT